MECCMRFAKMNRFVIKKKKSGYHFPIKLIFVKRLSSPVHSLPDQCRPYDSFFLGACVDLIHLRHAGGARTDKEHGFVVMSHFSNYQPLKGDHCWFVLLQEPR